jgi:hypothetical protein
MKPPKQQRPEELEFDAEAKAFRTRTTPMTATDYEIASLRPIGTSQTGLRKRLLMRGGTCERVEIYRVVDGKEQILCSYPPGHEAKAQVAR